MAPIPNSHQMAVVRVPIDQHGVCVAAPGSGKTFVLERHIPWLVAEGVNPANILAMTFTKRMAAEFKERVLALTPALQNTLLATAWKGLGQIGTIHGVSWRLVKEREPYLTKFEVRAPEHYSVHDVITDAMGVWDADWSVVSWYLNAAKAAGIPLVAAALTDFYGGYKLTERDIQRLVNIQLEVNHKLEQKGIITFADMPYKLERALAQDAGFRDQLQTRFTHILLDEGQDTFNQAVRICKLIGPEHFLTVGDQDQCLFRFSNAEPEKNLLEGFDTDWGGERYTLPLNYRSTQTIVDTSQLLIQYNYDQDTKQYYNEVRPRDSAPAGAAFSWEWFQTPFEEAEAVAEHIESLLADGAEAGEIFVLARTNAQLAFMEVALVQRRLAFVNLGRSGFFGLRHVKMVLEYMRFANDPTNRTTLNYIANLASKDFKQPFNFKGRVKGVDWSPTRWLNKGRNDTLGFLGRLPKNKKELAEWNCKDYLDAGWALVNDSPHGFRWEAGLVDLERVWNALQPYLEDHVAMIGQIRDLVVDAQIAHQQGLTDVDTGSNKFEDLAVLAAISAQFATIGEFLEYVDMMLQASKDITELDDYVVLATGHKAKGMERKTVFVIGLSNGLLPHRFAVGGKPPSKGTLALPAVDPIIGLRDERCVCYVMVTRAKEQVFLSGVALWPTVPLTELPLQPSQFIREMGISTERAVIGPPMGDFDVEGEAFDFRHGEN